MKSAKPLSSSLLMSNLQRVDSDEDSANSADSLHEPEIFIGYTPFPMRLKSEAKNEDRESISHKNPSLQEFLDIWDNKWSDKQILAYFTHYLSDPRIIALDNAFNEAMADETIIIPKEIWQMIVSFEFGSAKNQIKRRYYHWIAHQRQEIYWIPFILGSIQCFGVFFVLFYVFVSGTSLHDAADIGAADITNNENTNAPDNDSGNDGNEITESVFDIRFYMALITVIAAFCQICGALRSYYLARFRYSQKLKRFKRIIHFDTESIGTNMEVNIDENIEDKSDDETEEKCKKVCRDLPNVEIDFNFAQVPSEFLKEDNSDSNGNCSDNESIHECELDYLIGINESDLDLNNSINNSNYTLEEMQLILCAWESYISFQRWINLSSLVVTDNLCDPYLICFVLHKYLYVLCISTYVFGQHLTVWQSLIPFIILFLSFSYLGLIVLDRISAKRAILYVLSMVGCCGIIIGIFAGILFLLSYLFYTDPIANIDNSGIDNIGNEYNYFNTTEMPFYEGVYTTMIYESTAVEIAVDSTGLISVDTATQKQTWWITDFFYPILAFILCSNTIRRIRNGFENNIPQIKYQLWSNCCFVSLIMTFATNSATWSNAELKAAFLLVFVYMGYLWAQMRLHQAVTRLKKIDYANKYLAGSKWVKKQLFWSWLGQLSKQF